VPFSNFRFSSRGMSYVGREIVRGTVRGDISGEGGSFDGGKCPRVLESKCRYAAVICNNLSSLGQYKDGIFLCLDTSHEWMTVAKNIQQET